ncbi:MAG: YraN family protein [Pseudomonadota bacterium]
MSGASSYYGGLAAEDGVERSYADQGHEIAGRRWRCAAGEIDLITRKGGEVIFVEVKKARSIPEAAQRLGRRQQARIALAAEVFLGGEPAGTDTPARFDVALVDRTGQMEIIENAFAA